MPKYSTTAKGVDAPFVKRTAAPVTVGGESVTVFFSRGEKGGWVAFAGPDMHRPFAAGKTLDGAVDALIEGVSAPEGAEGDVAAETAPAPAPAADVFPAEMIVNSGTDDTADAAPAAPVKAEPVKAEKSAPMTGAKLSTLVMSAYRESAAAVTEANARKITVESAEKITCRAYATIFELVAEGRRAGLDADKVNRLSRYALGLVSHHNALMGGGLGSRMTRSQNKHARTKLAAVAASLV